MSGHIRHGGHKKKNVPAIPDARQMGSKIVTVNLQTYMPFSRTPDEVIAAAIRRLMQ
jgi:hypothetical protein